MSYITNADIEERLGSATLLQLADDDGDSVADAGIADEARLGAQSEVDSYLARRFSTPIDLTAHPELVDSLASITLDLAEYRLRLRRPPVSEDARRRRDEAVGWLSRVSDGRLTLAASSPPSSRVAEGTIAQVTGAERLLSREEMTDV